jgi:hypothetical protein
MDGSERKTDMHLNRLLISTCLWIGLFNHPSLQAAKPLIQYGPAQHLADLKHRKINESSGIAASHLQAGIFWTHNDSGDDPRIYRFDGQGTHLGTCQIKGAKAIDWEDMCSFQIKGVSYLLLADVGDNGKRRESYSLYLLREPSAGQKTAELEATFTFQYEDGPHNCESIAYDPVGHQFVIVTKMSRGACTAFLLPWPKQPSKQQVAKSIGALKVPIATAMDISPDGLRAIIVTYLDAYEFTRQEDENWKTAFARPPRRISMPLRRQGESICFGQDGKSLFLTSEKLPTPLYHMAPLQKDKN